LRCDLSIGALLASVKGGKTEENADKIRRILNSLHQAGVGVTTSNAYIFLTKARNAPDTISFSRWYTLLKPRVHRDEHSPARRFGPRVELYQLLREPRKGKGA
jgi:hypothetical protein